MLKPSETQQRMKTRVNWPIGLAASYFVLSLTACRSKTDATADNFAKTIDDGLVAKNVYLCSPELSFPVRDGQNLRALWPDTFTALQALERAGKVKSRLVPVQDRSDAVDGSGQVKAWSPVDDKDPLFVHQMKSNLDGVGKHLVGQYCYGKKRVEKVLKWEGPSQMGGSTIAIAYYTYKLDNLQPWARNPVLRSGTHLIGDHVDGQGKTLVSAPLVLTNKGWEVQAN